jgi:hypothetical protein
MMNQMRRCRQEGWSGLHAAFVPLCLLLGVTTIWKLMNTGNVLDVEYQNDLLDQTKEKTIIAGTMSVESVIHRPAVPRLTQTTAIIDFVSVGSLHKPEYQEAQHATFASHENVRHFFTVTELNDTDSRCHTDFTDKQFSQVVKYCRTGTPHQTRESKLLRTLVFRSRHATWWVCAQKRPIDGVHMALEQYKEVAASSAASPLPDYLLIIDDDTYVNVDRITATVHEHYPVHETHVVAGCLFTRLGKLKFTFPFGGFGSILTKAAIQRLMQPINCNNTLDMDDFTRHACWRLQLNLVGERQYFEDGMSVGDLMYKYSAELPFTGAQTWTNAGYCFHSDHALAYFFNFYHLAVPDELLMLGDFDDRLRMEHSYARLAGDDECKNKEDKCSVDSRICHYTKPEQMERLHIEQRRMKVL